jgi:hypothetical protein
MAIVDIVKDMISAIPDGAANMRDRVEFFVSPDELMELAPWLNEWNKAKEGKFNGRWAISPYSRDNTLLSVFFKATGM